MAFFGNRTSASNFAKNKTAAHRPAIESLEGRTLLTTVVVNTLSDALFPPSTGLISLRNAVATANASSTPTTIKFSPTVFSMPNTIALSGTGLVLTNTSAATTIIGPEAGLTVSGSNKSAVFAINGNVTATLTKLNITQGNASGIANNGILALTDSAVFDNSVGLGGIYGTYGGGITNSGTLTLINDTISGNTEVGAQPNNNGPVTVAGGIANSGTVKEATDITVTGNSAGKGYTGGIFNLDQAQFQEIFNIANSIVAGNFGTFPDVQGNFNSYGYNLIGATVGSTGFGTTDLTGVKAKLGKLANNGGPTETILPLAGSPALSAGSVTFIPKGVTTDQRGLPRVVAGKVDIGAVEVQPTPIVTVTPPAAQTAIDGQSKAILLGNFVETGATGPYKATVNWGDGSAAASVAVAAPGTIPATAHTYAKAGTFTVTESIADSASHTSNTATFKVTVTPPPPTGSISGEVFNDGNGDGKLDAGEFGLGLWTVDLLSGGKLVRTAVTNINGDFSFAALAAGTYVVKVVQVTGTKPTKPTGGTLTLTLTAGEVSKNNLFGEEAIA